MNIGSLSEGQLSFICGFFLLIAGFFIRVFLASGKMPRIQPLSEERWLAVKRLSVSKLTKHSKCTCTGYVIFKLVIHVKQHQAQQRKLDAPTKADHCLVVRHNGHSEMS